MRAPGIPETKNVLAYCAAMSDPSTDTNFDDIQRAMAQLGRPRNTVPGGLFE
jgi:hypothetical protein